MVDSSNFHFYFYTLRFRLRGSVYLVMIVTTVLLEDLNDCKPCGETKTVNKFIGAGKVMELVTNKTSAVFSGKKDKFGNLP